MSMGGQSSEYGELQYLIDRLFRTSDHVEQVDLVLAAEDLGLSDDLMEICTRVPSGVYGRARLCTKMNASIVAHGWARRYGLVE